MVDEDIKLVPVIKGIERVLVDVEEAAELRILPREVSAVEEKVVAPLVATMDDMGIELDPVDNDTEGAFVAVEEGAEVVSDPREVSTLVRELVESNEVVAELLHIAAFNGSSKSTRTAASMPSVSEVP